MSSSFVVLMIASLIILVVALRVLRRMIGLPILSFGLKQATDKSPSPERQRKELHLVQGSRFSPLSPYSGRGASVHFNRKRGHSELRMADVEKHSNGDHPLE
jgi:hypothetical protein